MLVDVGRHFVVVLSVCLSVCIYVCLSGGLAISRYVCMSLSLHPCVHLPACCCVSVCLYNVIIEPLAMLAPSSFGAYSEPRLGERGHQQQCSGLTYVPLVRRR